MALASVVYPISLFWLILHAIHRFWITRTPQSILPSHGRAPSRGLGLPVKITLRHVYLRIDTNALNDDHDRLAVAFAKRRRALWTRAVIAFYDLGSIAGALGLFIALYLVLSTVLWSLRLSWNVPAASKPVYTTFSKRQFTEQDVGMAGSASRDAPVQLIIPGVTLPLSHLPILVLALFACQVIHEAGHAITAAMESLPLLSVGASLTLILPSAYVSLPSSGVENLSPRARLRVISSGAFHNLVLWAILAGISSLGLASFVASCLGYRDVGSLGKAVIWVNEESPLRTALPIGAVVTKLDDTSLASTDRSHDPWASYLSARQAVLRHEDGLGWCVDTVWYQSQPESCCAATQNSANVASSCFTADAIEFVLEDSGERCVATLEVLRPDVEVVKRCMASADCTDGNVCVTLREDQHVIRIVYVERRDAVEEKTVVWNGPPEELFQDVDTSTFLPRFGFLPLWLPSLFGTLFDYASTLTLSLYLFNLLPLPLLDGSQLADALAELGYTWLSSRHTATRRVVIDMEMGAVQPSMYLRTWKTQYERGKWATQLALGLMVAVGIVAALWRQALQ